MMPVFVNLWNPSVMSITRVKRPLSVFFLCFSLFLAGCGTNIGFPGVYRIDVEQGNIITPEMVEQLQQGMTRRQVRFILGTPLIEDTFNEDRWDYRYTLRNSTDTREENVLTVYFEGDELASVTGDMLPEWASPREAMDSDESFEVQN